MWRSAGKRLRQIIDINSGMKDASHAERLRFLNLIAGEPDTRSCVPSTRFLNSRNR